MIPPTLDFGIELGLRESRIAVMTDHGPELIVNNQGGSSTPAAVYIDRNEKIRVGQDALNRRIQDQDNTDLEFRSRMGMGERGKKRFAASGIEMTPQQLTAVVLKSLRNDVQAMLGTSLNSATITVPSAFDLTELDATREAARLAGLEACPLLMEPVAVAIAYGFDSESDGCRCLVFHLGASFEAAVLKMRKGAIRLIGHTGDSQISDDLFDSQIVDTLLAPLLTSRYQLNDFHRGNPVWRLTFAKLQFAARQARIEISQSRTSYELFQEDLQKDDSGRMMDLEAVLTPEDIRKCLKPAVDRTLTLSRQLMESRQFSGSVYGRVLMSGTASTMPWLHERIERELGIPVDCKDPSTAIIRGATIYARSQSKSYQTPQTMPPENPFQLQLNYEAIGSDEDPELDGQVLHPQEKSLSGYSIEFVETRSQWTSGRIPLKSDGAFDTVLLAERGRKCEFAISLYDPTGTKLATDPELIPYTMGLVIDGVPLIHSIGIAHQNNQVDMLIRKGTALPARSRLIYRTQRDARRGDGKPLLSFAIVEGENVARADRNRHVGMLQVASDKIERDLPEGSEIEITLEIDKLRLITARAYIPILDQEFEATIKLGHGDADPFGLRKRLQCETDRLEKLSVWSRNSRKPVSDLMFWQIELDQITLDLEAAMQGQDLDAMQSLQARIEQLRESINQFEQEM